MGRWVGKGKNRRYQVKRGNRWSFAKAPTRRKSKRGSTRKASTVAKRRWRGKRKRSSAPKNPSLSKTLILIGAGATVSATIAGAATQAMAAASPLLAKVGITTGAGVVGAAIAAKALCSKSRAWRGIWVPFLASYGLRP